MQTSTVAVILLSLFAIQWTLTARNFHSLYTRTDGVTADAYRRSSSTYMFMAVFALISAAVTFFCYHGPAWLTAN